MRELRLARCKECQKYDRCVEFHGYIVCHKCLSAAVSMLVNGKLEPRRKKKALTATK